VTWRVVLPRCPAVNRKHEIQCGEIRPFVRSTDRNRVACTGSPGRGCYHWGTSVLPVLCTALINPTSRPCAVYVLLLYLGDCGKAGLATRGERYYDLLRYSGPSDSQIDTYTSFGCTKLGQEFGIPEFGPEFGCFEWRGN
jgi:hypothetical protein